ncbi:MAG: hypothetical protein LBD02_05735 [Christensenellaceae bacterium]|nr:hypothetical protein [Christensenellaceae bacterium]
MKTLIVLYSKSGNTKKLAERVRAALGCALDEIRFDEKAHEISAGLDPAGFERVILMCPVWAFNLPEPMTLYLKRYGAGIGRYRLAVTCGGLGLRGCVAGCKRLLAKAPESAVKIRAKAIQAGDYTIEGIVN